MGKGVYSILKARFLVNEDATRKLAFHRFSFSVSAINDCQRHTILNKKFFRISKMTNEVKELRSEFVDKRSELMKLKMESTVSEKMEESENFPIIGSATKDKS